MSDEELSGSEAVFGVLAWLSTRDIPLAIGAHHDCAVLADLAKQFCETNGLVDPRDGWSDRLTHPPVKTSSPDDDLSGLPDDSESDRDAPFLKELASALNKCCMENGSDTPDFILAEYLLGCLEAFEAATRARDGWYGPAVQTLTAPKSEIHGGDNDA